MTAEQVQATLVSFEGANTTDDGEHILLKLGIGGKESVVALPIRQARATIVAMLQKEAEATKKVAGGSTAKLVMEAEGWSVGRGDGKIILTFMIGSGELSFSLSSDAATYMKETLQSLLGDEAIRPEPGTILS